MIKAAIIGCGREKQGKEGWAIGHQHGSGWRRNGVDVQLAAVDIDQANLDSFAERFGVDKDHCFTSTDALYATVLPDVVSICTWPGLHRAQVVQAAKAGVKVIVCEKPLGMDRSEIDEMTQACRDNAAHLMVAHQRRYNATFEAARDMIAHGEIGTPVVGQARVGDGWDMLSWTVHWFDMAGFLFDDRPTRILAGIDQTGSRRYQHAVEDSSVVFAEYSQGHQAIFVTGPNEPLGSAWRIAGPEGELRLTEQGSITLINRDGLQTLEIQQHPEGDFGRMLARAADVAKGKIKSTRCDAIHTSIGTEMAYAAQEAARTCRAVDVSRQRSRFAPLEVMQHEPKPQPIAKRAVLLADPHHVDEATGLTGRDGLCDALAATIAEQVDVVLADQRELTEADLAHCDLLVVYHTVRTATREATRKLITAYVESGRTMLVTHCGIGAYSDWPEFRRWIGRYWVWDDEHLPASGHPHLSCVIEPTRALNVQWAQAWLPRDEVYVGLAEAGPIEVLAHMRAEGIHAPAIWRSGTKANVVVMLPGHRGDMWDLPLMRDQLRASAS